MNAETTLRLSMCITACFLLSGCISEKENELMQFDVTASYPEKEIQLEEIADIEYVQLVLDDDFMFGRAPQIIISDKIIIGHDGNVFIFSRDGMPESKFNKTGNGPGEYISIDKLRYDEALGEIYIETSDEIMVYSLSGDYKGTIPLRGRMGFFSEIINYDSETLLLYDDYNLYPSPFSFISKKDGSIVDSIKILQGENVPLYVPFQDRGYILLSSTCPIVKYKEGYLLTDFTNDTVYFLSARKELSPILVKTPKIQSLDPVVYVNSFVEAGNYVFVSAVTVKQEDNRLPKKYLMRDKRSGAMYRQKITFNDYEGKRINLSPEIIANTQHSKLGLIVLDINELLEANKENKLSGKLKQLVESSEEEGNNVFMLLHFK